VAGQQALSWRRRHWMPLKQRLRVKT
jgi:hypothetical protein